MKKDFITIKINRTRYVKIFEDDILYCKADGSYSEIITEKERHVSTKNLKEIEQLLVNEKFIRVSRSHIVNINKCSELMIGRKPLLILQNAEQLGVEPNYKDKLISIFCKNK